MRIVGLKEFLAMPRGTVAQKYEPVVFDEIFIKGETLEKSGDFFLTYLTGQIEHKSSDEMTENCLKAESGERVKMDFWIQERDGCFDPDQLFAVWDETDIEGIINRLGCRFQ